jgi:hypothetical protein
VVVVAAARAGGAVEPRVVVAAAICLWRVHHLLAAVAALAGPWAVAGGGLAVPRGWQASLVVAADAGPGVVVGPVVVGSLAAAVPPVAVVDVCVIIRLALSLVR